MAFFFLLHTPGPADLELRGKVGRTQTGSFWRLPIGRRTARVRRSGEVVRERRLGRWIGVLASAINFFVCQLILASFVLAATAVNAAAQEAPKIEEAKGKPGELKLPDDLMVDAGKAGKKLRPPACDKCKDEWNALKAALAAYYAAQSVEGYQNSSKGQNFKDQEKAGNSGMKDILGMSDKEMTAARKDYNTAKKDSKKQNSVKPDALLKAINDALAALKKCEKCPKPEKPVEKKDEKKDDVVEEWHWPGFDKLPGYPSDAGDFTAIKKWAIGINLPDCGDPKKLGPQLQELIKELDGLLNSTQAAALGHFAETLKTAAKEAEEALKAAKSKVEDYIKKTLPKLKPCDEKPGGVKEGPKSIKFIFRGFGYYSRPGGNTYNVTFSGDSTQQCTFADGAGVPAPVEFADAKGNPLETYFDPKTGESSDFGPDETPPPGWKKVIPTTDPKPKPGMWNLGHQPELWVDPETGQTKWVEVGSDYKPVDPPQGWVELVPRSEPSKPTAETPPERSVTTTETPPRTTTPETPRTPTTTETPQAPTTTEAPPRTPDTPPARTTDAPPTTPTSDDIPSTVFVKANEEVLQGTPTGQPLASQTVKLLAERPALPSSREIKTAQDTGFDKPPAQCTTGADGRCKFEVPADERPVYGLPVADTAARRPNYRVEFNALKSSGGVAEITGRKPATESAPADGNLASDLFNIGNRIFQRFGFNTPYESREDVEASYRSAFGDKYQVDTCETKKLPGLPLGIEPSSFNEPNHELSQATIKLGRTARYGRASR
jgi:hypothetical protein